MSAWSYPASVSGDNDYNASSLDLHPLTTVSSGSCSAKPRLASAQVLGGYGLDRGAREVEKGLAAFATPLGSITDISTFRLFGWLVYVWVPFASLLSTSALSLPYLIITSQRSVPSTGISVAFILSITMSSPILAINILFRSPIPIPSGLFDVHEPASDRFRRVFPIISTDAPFRYSKEYKRSMSTSPTVIEGRRSGDVWITNGDAVEGKSKMGRVMGMLPPIPKLSVLPEVEDEDSRTQPLTIRNEDLASPVNLHNRSHSETNAQIERHRKDSIVSSRLSEARDSIAYAGKVMIAQRHYSALAQTIVVACPSEKDQSAKAGKVFGSATGAMSANVIHQSIHLRSRSVSSINGPQNLTSGASLTPSPPPTFPLPPTPPRMKAARFVCPTKSFSSGYSFGPVEDMNEIDSLSARVLPLLVPGINLNGIKIREEDYSPIDTSNKSKSGKAVKDLEEFREEFSSPEDHSTPVIHRTREQQSRKTFGHKRNRHSLPSYGLGKYDMRSSSKRNAENQTTLKSKTDGYFATSTLTVENGRRNNILGSESKPNDISHLHTNKGAGELNRAKSTRFLGLRADVPHGLDTPRDSLSSMVPPFSAASSVTLFEEFVAGLGEDPEAQSTPHNNHLNKPTLKYPGSPFSQPEEELRSSDLYNRFDDHSVPTNPDADTTTTSSAILALAQWSTQAVRPLIPKVIEFYNGSNTNSPQSDSQPGFPGGNLRPLLLQSRDNNLPPSPVLNSVRPLALGKRQKARSTALMQNQNAKLDSVSSRSKNLKPLKLVQSDTIKVRDALRKD
ncbi:hypothetical protein C0992_007036 [Termitomyces sp. T32_za158]|nr:hypothetical protein C0992_007036 [Termitomyces sp. T32_za158]